MSFRRYFSGNLPRQTQSKFALEINRIKASHIPELPVEKSIALSSQDLSGKVRIDDAKAPLVMIHGLFGARQNYSSVGRKISAATLRRTIGVDMRNHGASRHVFPHDYTHMACDTIRFLDSLGEKVILAGHLMGAKVSMLVALQRPELIEKLIVIDNSPKSETLDHRFTCDLLAMCRVEEELHVQPKNQVNLLKDADRIMAAYEHDALVRMFLASNLKRPTKKHDAHGEHVKFRIPVANFLKHDILSKMGDWPTDIVKNSVFQKPTLVMRALNSGFILNDDLRNQFPRHFSNFEMVDYGCGHWLVSEQPDKFVKDTINFLERS